MRRITRCPACGTLFRVVPDQLRVSDGWVRCGQCQETFDASLHLQTEAQPGNDSDLTAAEPTREEAQQPAAPHFLDINPHGLAHKPVDAPELTDLTEPSLDFPLDPPAQDLDQDIAQDPDLGSQFHHAFLAPQATTPPAQKHRALKRVAWLLLCTALSCGLLLQIAVSERDWIAATRPDTKPWLQLLCDSLDCEIAPLQQIETVVIDSSSFTKVRADVYRLSFTLRNTASISIATPAVELSLTDLQDHVLVRRVFPAAELGKNASVIEPGTELAVMIPMSVKATGIAERVSGYRLLSFYP